MAEQNELISAEIDIETYHALASVQDFARAVRTADQSLKDTDSTIKKTETSLASFDAYVLKYGEDAGKMYQKAAEAAEKASEREVRAHETARKQIESHNTQLARETENAAKANVRANEQWATSIQGVIAAYAGFSAIRQVLSELEDQQRKVIEGRDKLVSVRLDLNRQLQEVIFQLQLPKTQQSQNQVLNLIKGLTESAPGATIEQATAVTAAAGSFGLKPITSAADRDYITNILRTVAPAQLDAETSGNLVRYLMANKATSQQDQLRVLARLQAAAAKSPVEKQREFVPYGLRATIPLINAGLTDEEALGLFAATASGETSPRVAATQVEAFSKVFEGTDEKGAANIFQRAVDAGLLSAQQFSGIRGQITQQISPNYQSRVNNLQSTVTDAQKDLIDSQQRYERDIADIQGKIRKAKELQHPTDQLENRLENKRVAFETRQRELNEQITRATQSLEDINRVEGGKIAQKFGSAAWRSLPLSQRYRLYRALAERATDQEEFFRDTGVTSSSERAARNIMSFAGQTATQETAQAMAGANPATLQQENQQFTQLDIAQDVATQNRIRFEEATSVGTPEELNRLLSQESASRATRIAVTGLGRPASAGLGEDRWKLYVYASDLSRQIVDFINGMSVEERQKFPQIMSLQADLQSFLTGGWVSGYASMVGITSLASGKIGAISIQFFRIQAEVIRNRRANPNASRTRAEQLRPSRVTKTDTAIFNSGVPDVPHLGAAEGEFNTPVSGFGAIPSVGGTATPAPTTQPAASGALGPQSMINYNVSIGTVVSGGSDVLNTVGRLTASENA